MTENPFPGFISSRQKARKLDSGNYLNPARAAGSMSVAVHMLRDRIPYREQSRTHFGKLLGRHKLV